MPNDRPSDGVVLDTHVWVWMSDGHPRALRLKDYSGPLFLSAISIWELAMLHSQGRLTLKPNIDSWVKRCLLPPVRVLPLEPETSLLSCRLPGDYHGDPADRIIMASALHLNLPLVTADTKMIAYAQKHAHHIWAIA